MSDPQAPSGRSRAGTALAFLGLALGAALMVPPLADLHPRAHLAGIAVFALTAIIRLALVPAAPVRLTPEAAERLARSIAERPAGPRIGWAAIVLALAAALAVGFAFLALAALGGCCR